MSTVPTCLASLGLDRHSLVPDLLRPALDHHRLELGLAFLRASLDHLRIGHLGLVLGIDWQLQLGIRSLPSPPRPPMSWRSMPPAALSLLSFGSNSKFIFRNFTRKLKLSILRLPLIFSGGLALCSKNNIGYPICDFPKLWREVGFILVLFFGGAFLCASLF